MRDLAIRDGYRGDEQPVRAFSLALLLDELGRHVRDLDDELRTVVVQACRTLLGRVQHGRLYPLVPVQWIDGRGTAGLQCPQCAQVRLWYGADSVAVQPGAAQRTGHGRG